MFGSFAEANCERQVFESTEWASRMEDRVAALLKRKTASPVSIPELAAIVAWMMDNKDEINILDFGGGIARPEAESNRQGKHNNVGIFDETESQRPENTFVEAYGGMAWANAEGAKTQAALATVGDRGVPQVS